MLKITGKSLFKDSNEIVFPTASFEDENKKLTPVNHTDSHRFCFFDSKYVFKRKFKKGYTSVLEINSTNIQEYPQTKFLISLLKSEYIKENEEEVRNKVSGSLFMLFEYLDINPKIIYNRKYSSTEEFLQFFNEVVTNRKKELELIKPVEIKRLIVLEKQLQTIDLNSLVTVNNAWYKKSKFYDNITNPSITIKGTFNEGVPVYTYTYYLDNNDYSVTRHKSKPLHKIGDVISGDYSKLGWIEKEIRDNCEIFLL